MGIRICFIDEVGKMGLGLSAAFLRQGIRISLFGSQKEFLEIWNQSQLKRVAIVVLVGVSVSSRSSLNLLAALRARGLASDNRAIYVTDDGDVQLAVEAMQLGADDFIEICGNEEKVVERVIESARLARELHRYRAFACSSEFNSLTARQKDIALLIVDGVANRVIAEHLSLSVRSVEYHRSIIFDRLHVEKAVELAAFVKNPAEFSQVTKLPASRTPAHERSIRSRS